MPDKERIKQQLEWLKKQEMDHFLTEEEKRALEDLRERIEFDCE